MSRSPPACPRSRFPTTDAAPDRTRDRGASDSRCSSATSAAFAAARVREAVVANRIPGSSAATTVAVRIPRSGQRPTPVVAVGAGDWAAVSTDTMIASVLVVSLLT